MDHFLSARFQFPSLKAKEKVKLMVPLKFAMHYEEIQDDCLNGR